MRVVVQKVQNASVLIDNKNTININEGFVVMLGIHKDDTTKDITYMIKKIINLRVFEENEKMRLSLNDVAGEILLISNFTLYANVKKGNRPSFEESMEFNKAKILYDEFVDKLKESYKKVKTGNFGSYMKVSLINDGPVTIIIDSKENKS